MARKQTFMGMSSEQRTRFMEALNPSPGGKHGHAKGQVQYQDQLLNKINLFQWLRMRNHC
ncbi:hypothetical protein BBB56_19865 [Candidatus Pantoea deserta]|uniref:Uncharacterized protein n=1 Tax=Candidatus Pantoea deserta TaxID=1869313 RepID=A0A3N4NI67_9GAMM|nr:hypothetical protein BBB56_19865 [Pantoea deserta]